MSPDYKQRLARRELRKTGRREKARQRRRIALDKLQKEWRLTPPTARVLKPFSDLAEDVERRADRVLNDKKYDCRKIWQELADSVSAGFFDGEHSLTIIAGDRKWRLTSKLIRETEKSGYDGEYIRLALVRASWARIGTIALWARHQRYELPVAWQDGLLNTIKREETIKKVECVIPLTSKKRPKKLEATIECLRRLDLSKSLSLKQELLEVNNDLSRQGITVSESVLKAARRAIREA